MRYLLLLALLALSCESEPNEQACYDEGWYDAACAANPQRTICDNLCGPADPDYEFCLYVGSGQLDDAAACVSLLCGWDEHPDWDWCPGPAGGFY